MQTSMPNPKIRTSYYISRTFVRPHIDIGDTIYEKAYNSSFHQKRESIQYNKVP